LPNDIIKPSARILKTHLAHDTFNTLSIRTVRKRKSMDRFTQKLLKKDLTLENLGFLMIFREIGKINVAHRMGANGD
jgi:hypothetical protein